jgi:hypothetical protein
VIGSAAWAGASSASIPTWTWCSCTTPLATRCPTGARPLEAARWFARLAQKLIALLGTETAAGKLYEIDVRLRPTAPRACWCRA